MPPISAPSAPSTWSSPAISSTTRARRDELLAFARSVRANLKPGGRLVGMNNNPRNAPERYGSFAAYGFSRDIELPRREGSRIRYTFAKPDGSTFGFDNFWLAPETYERVFAEAGFKDFRFVDAVGRSCGRRQTGATSCATARSPGSRRGGKRRGR